MKRSNTIIIAEAGVNHNGSMDLAMKMIDVAAEAKVDFIKFQTFIASELVTQKAEKAEYQKNSSNNESQLEMLKSLELDSYQLKDLINYCNKKNIKFLSTAFDHESIDLLASLNIPLYKIPSGEISNLPYLRHIGKMNKPVVMSTGMSTLDEVKIAASILFESGLNKSELTILHCNTEYPTPLEDVNLHAMLTIKEELGVQIGYSDHTLGIEIPIAAVAMGATIIEKHFTLDRTLPGPDHSSSLEPNELNEMVSAIRNIEKAFGNGIKKPSKSELRNLPIARRSIVAKTNIKKGELFTKNNLTVKRPGTGISPMKWDEIIGSIAAINYVVDDLIQ